MAPDPDTSKNIVEIIAAAGSAIALIVTAYFTALFKRKKPSPPKVDHAAERKVLEEHVMESSVQSLIKGYEKIQVAYEDMIDDLQAKNTKLWDENTKLQKKLLETTSKFEAKILGLKEEIIKLKKNVN